MEEEEGEAIRRAFRVVGRVQGVGFRWWTHRTASRLGLGGWVRNEVDGSVVVHVVGPEEAVGRLASELRRGPTAARVDEVETIEATGVLSPGEFRIEV